MLQAQLQAETTVFTTSSGSAGADTWVANASKVTPETEKLDRAGEPLTQYGSATENNGKKDRVSEVSFETLGQGDDSIDTRVVIVNEALMKPDGSGPVRNLDIGTRGFGSMPLAFLISLILASPVPWPRRSKAVMWGIFWQQVSVF
jgi:hypothetical protein